MPGFNSQHVPAYRLYKRTGQAVVTIGGRDHYLGRHNTPASHEAYNQLIAKWFSAGRDAQAFAVTNSTPVAGATI